jgi:hypothetical protein
MTFQEYLTFFFFHKTIMTNRFCKIKIENKVKIFGIYSFCKKKKKTYNILLIFSCIQ